MSIWTFIGWNVILWGWCAGLGRLVAKVQRSDTSTPWANWSGFCVLVGLLPILHAGLPMGTSAAIVVSILAVVGWVIPRSGERIRVSNLGAEAGWFAGWLVLLGAIGWPCAMGVSLNAGSGFFFQQIESWAQACPVVPGLGNLHSPLAPTHASLLLTGLLDSLLQGPWGARLLGPFLLTRCVVFFVRLHLAKRGQRPDVLAWAALVLAMVAVVALSASGAVVASPDFVVGLLAAVAGLHILSHGPEDSRPERGTILGLVVGMILVENASVPLAVALFATSLVVFGKAPGWRSVGFWSIAVCGWLIHDWVQSGHLLLLVPISMGSPDWAMPSEALRGFHPGFRIGSTWAGIAGDPFPRWMGILIAVSAGAWILFGRNLDGFRARGVQPLLVAMVLVAGWWGFFSSEDRPPIGVVWLGSALLCAAMLAPIEQRFASMFLRLSALASLLVFAIDLGRGPTTPLNPRTAMQQVRLPSGLVVHVPVQGDKVWRAPIPATPEITDLIPRGPSLCEGFRAGGRPLRLVHTTIDEVAPQAASRP